MSPAAMRSAPSQIAATVETFSTSITVGNMNAMSRPARSEVIVSSSFASANRVGLVGLADERAHDAHAGDLLAQHRVDLVDALLHDLELRDHPDDHQPDADHEHRDAHQQEQREGAVLAHREDHAADDRERRGDEERAGHEDEDLHLRHVVGDAGDQRRRAVRGDVLGREVGHPVEQVAADVAPERHRDARAVVHGARSRTRPARR